MTNTARARKRRFFQFSMRTMLIVVTVFVLWLGSVVRAARDQQRAASAIVALGGTIGYDYEYDLDGKHIYNASPDGPEWLRSLLGDEYFRNVVHVYFLGTRVSDEDLVVLKCFPKLRRLELLFTAEVHGSALRHIPNGAPLDELILGQTGVTDEGLKHLARLSRMRSLYLYGSRSTDITDAGLDHLRGLRGLKYLDVGKSVTDESLQRLKQSLPNLEINCE